MKAEKPEWMKLKELHDGEMIETGGHGRGGPERPRSFGAVYGPSESNVDQVGDGLIDVNDLMARFDKMPTAAELYAAGFDASGGFYADFVGAPDYEQALQIANSANAQFALLPAGIRGRFENDPRRFLEFVTDPVNKDEVIRMGLASPAKPKPEPEVGLKEVVDAIKSAPRPLKGAKKGEESSEG